MKNKNPEKWVTDDVSLLHTVGQAQNKTAYSLPQIKIR